MKAFTVRFDDDVYRELDEISLMLKQSKNQIVNDLVRQSYNQLIAEDPKVREAIDKLNEFKSMLEKFAEK